MDGEAPETPVALPVEDALDLHPFRPDETAAAVAEYVVAAAAKGFREVRLVHGRGIGVQRAIVRRALERSPHVVSFADATPDRGGWGATVAVLAPAPRVGPPHFPQKP
jgi:DNA-nicking Smr family endonuclease